MPNKQFDSKRFKEILREESEKLSKKYHESNNADEKIILSSERLGIYRSIVLLEEFEKKCTQNLN